MKNQRWLLQILATVFATSASAQTISGRIVDAESNARVAAAEVLLVQIDSSASVITDSLGSFRFRAIEGMWTLRVRALGYQELVSRPLEVSKGENVTIVVVLTSSPIELLPVHVVARSRRPMSGLDEFHERMKRGHGFGYFLDRKAIERAPAYSVTDVLMRVPGARVEGDYVSLRPFCRDALYLVDGMPIYGGAGQSATDVVNMMVAADNIAGVEIYKGDAGVPAELRLHMTGAPGTEDSCGLIAIWTKR